jgi:hypothetical protein
MHAQIRRRLNCGKKEITLQLEYDKNTCSLACNSEGMMVCRVEISSEPHAARAANFASLILFIKVKP